MQINVSGKQVDLSDSLRTRVQSNLDMIAAKYFDHALEAHVTFGRARSFFTCDINVHAGRGLTLRAETEEEQPALADAHNGNGAPAAAFATVIAETQTEISHLSVSDAVMRMDLADQTVLMFRNSTTGAFNVVYRRSDGNIGWIDPGT
jgi:ribosomal subunit interface protein